MADAKYVIFESVEAGPAAVVFPTWLDHNWFRDARPNAEIISAGFVSWSDNRQVAAFGQSSILKVKSRPEDSDIIARQLGVKSEWD